MRVMATHECIPKEGERWMGQVGGCRGGINAGRSTDRHRSQQPSRVFGRGAIVLLENMSRWRGVRREVGVHCLSLQGVCVEAQGTALTAAWSPPRPLFRPKPTPKRAPPHRLATCHSRQDGVEVAKLLPRCPTRHKAESVLFGECLTYPLVS
jgi:hypothetical protein